MIKEREEILRQSLYQDLHGFGDPHPHRDKMLDPDPHLNQCGSGTRYTRLFY